MSLELTEGASQVDGSAGSVGRVEVTAKASVAEAPPRGDQPELSRRLGGEVIILSRWGAIDTSDHG